MVGDRGFGPAREALMGVVGLGELGQCTGVQGRTVGGWGGTVAVPHAQALVFGVVGPCLAGAALGVVEGALGAGVGGLLCGFEAVPVAGGQWPVG